jgi:hypothetical protein
VKAANNNSRQAACILSNDIYTGSDSGSPVLHRSQNRCNSRLKGRLKGKSGRYQHSTHSQCLVRQLVML